MNKIWLNAVMASGGAVELWTPAQATTDGGVSPLVWEVPGVANFQDVAKTTPSGVGDVVGAVVNQGSDTHDIVQATAANKPTLQQVTIDSVASYVWRFDGVNDVLQGAFGGGAISQPYTMFAVGKLDAGAVNDGLPRYLTDSNTGSGSGRLITGQNHDVSPNQFGMYGGNWLRYGLSNSNENIFTSLFAGASSSIWINGGTAVSGNAGTQSPLGIGVGGALSSGRWKGDIGQVLIYPGNLSTADKNQVGEYLERVTGIVWTTIP